MRRQRWSVVHVAICAILLSRAATSRAQQGGETPGAERAQVPVSGVPASEPSVSAVPANEPPVGAPPANAAAPDAPVDGIGQVAPAEPEVVVTTDTADTSSEGEFHPSLSIKVFSDLSWGVESGQNPAFQLGGVDFFFTADLSEQFSALSESVLEILEGGPVFDLERIYLEWHPKRWLQVRVGRDHVMLGRYMQTYHHALLFQLTSSRPALLAFEDEGGLLPAHQIGLEVKGDVTLPGTLLHYAVGIGNGRGQFADDIMNSFDRNTFRSLLAQLALLPDFAPGLELGLSGYLDRIPPGFTDAAGDVLITEPIGEYIAAAHVAYTTYPIDVQAEAYWLRHEGVRSGQKTKMLGGFAQFGFGFDPWTPYGRFEVIKRDANDLFFNVSHSPVELVELGAGLRYSLTDQAVLKVEYSHEFKTTTRKFVIQTAFGMP
jgi:hypothetical protein